MRPFGGDTDRAPAWPQRNVWWLSWTSFFTDVHSEMLLPILPFFMRSGLGASYTLIGAMEGFADGLASIVKLLSGRLSDRTGRRKPWVVLGYGLSWTAKVAMAAATGPWGVFALRSADRLGKGLRTSPRDALLAESTQTARRGRAFGLHRSMDTFGAVLGTVAAWFLLMHSWSYTRIFLVAAVPGFAALGILFLKVRDRTLSVSSRQRREWPRLSGALWGFLGVHTLFSLVYLNYALVLLLGVQNAGVRETWGPGFYLWFNIVYAASAFPVGRLSDAVDERVLIAGGYAIFVLMYAGLLSGAWGGIAGSVLIFTLYGFGVAVLETLPRSYLGKIAPGDHRATVLGLFHGLHGLAVFGGNTWMGWLWQHAGLRDMLVVLVLGSSVTAALFLAIMTRFPSTSPHRRGTGDPC